MKVYIVMTISYNNPSIHLVSTDMDKAQAKYQELKRSDGRFGVVVLILEHTLDG